MFSLLLLWLYCCYGANLSPEKLIQTAQSVKISGSCYDVATGVDLKIRAFALYGNRKLDLGHSNESGIFTFQIPDSTRYLSFERNGYQTALIPVNFLGKIENNASYYVTIPITARDSLPVKPTNQLYWNFQVPVSLEIQYEIKYARNLSFFTEFNSAFLKKAPYFFLRDVRQGDYILTASTADGHVLLNESITVRPGFNFKSIRIEKPLTSNHSAAALLAAKTLYFDQSSYELRRETLATLDSISRLLANQRDLVVQVTGYTDNVGERNLNITLSEYRAKTVANYLRKKGALSRQIRTDWKGADSPMAPNDSEETKTRNRRVVIQFSHN